MVELGGPWFEEICHCPQCGWQSNRQAFQDRWQEQLHEWLTRRKWFQRMSEVWPAHAIVQGHCLAFDNYWGYWHHKDELAQEGNQCYKSSSWTYTLSEQKTACLQCSPRHSHTLVIHRTSGCTEVSLGACASRLVIHNECAKTETLLPGEKVSVLSIELKEISIPRPPHAGECAFHLVMEYYLVVENCSGSR